MSVHFAFSRTIDITQLYLQVKRKTFRFVRYFGLFIGNTFIGIARARR